MSKRFRLALATAVGALLLAGYALGLQDPPSRAYDDYALIGLTSIRLNGAAHVFSGGVGVNAFGSPDSTLGQPGTLYLSHYGIFEPGVVAVANMVRLSNQTDVGMVFANRFFPAPGAVYQGPQPFDAAPGRTLFTDLPTLPPFDCPSSSASGALVLGHLVARTVDAGIFHDLFLKDDAQITLTGGVYQFDSIRLGKRAILTANAPTTVNVCGEVRLSSGAALVSGRGAATSLHVNVAGTRVVLSHDDVVTAIVHAPNAHLQLGGPSALRGQFLGDVVTSDSRVDLTCDTGGKLCPIPVPTTTTLPGGRATTTTLRPARPTTTTTTLPGERVGKEICGNCIDDDGDGLTDFEDPDCCQQQQAFTMTLRRGRIRAHGATSFLRIKSLLAAAGLSHVDPFHQDVFLQIRPAGGPELLCAQMPASHFMRMHGDPKFWDRKHKVPSAQGIDDLRLHFAKDGSLRLRTIGHHVRFAAPAGGRLQVTVGFRDTTLGPDDQSTNRCSRVSQAFRTIRGGALRAP